MNLNKACNFRSFKALSSMLNHFIFYFKENITDMSVRKWQTAKSWGSVKISNVRKEALIIPPDEFLTVFNSHIVKCPYDKLAWISIFKISFNGLPCVIDQLGQSAKEEFVSCTVVDRSKERVTSSYNKHLIYSKQVWVTHW